MRATTTLLLAASGCLASAHWVKWRGGAAADDRVQPWAPKQTGASQPDDVRGWTPKPTAAPGARLPPNEAVLGYLKGGLARRQTTTGNAFILPSTCGYYAGVSSEPFTCEQGATCTTSLSRSAGEVGGVVGCASGSEQPFFTVCLDRQAYLQGACDAQGSKTGCCTATDFGACGTFLWGGSTTRSMYRCVSKPELVSLLDVPHLTSSPTTSKSTTSTATNPADNTGTADSSTNNSGGSSSGGGSNIGAIVGGAVGGVAALGLIAAAIAFVVLRNRNKTKGGSVVPYSAVAPTDTSYPGGGPGGAGGGGGGGGGYQQSASSPQMLQDGTPFYPSGASLASTAAYNNNNNPSNNPNLTPYLAAGAFDQRQSAYAAPYYDPNKPDNAVYAPYPPPHMQQQQQPYVMSELDSHTVAAGRPGNPAEMAAIPSERAEMPGTGPGSR
ncbi:hypothetical protein B0T26DRAFT_738271 [Lasiosphaeria miniovina]|uniref:Carcinoembryonic antigen-related cell adhesion molecule 1 n=1 Tax=Lasiosphaeria miniovina TaxID=1954250 RepID=A0AA40B4Y9_9PEZI|nr:uncharacterized protein B0T26DRAFT_738271 [Lasiosphaeria miniovina]KAK0727637.1 hypothetical protein B0T26DRAFT_738271 [Lasiosphaeria miniovina]